MLNAMPIAASLIGIILATCTYGQYMQNSHDKHRINSNLNNFNKDYSNPPSINVNDFTVNSKNPFLAEIENSRLEGAKPCPASKLKQSAVTSPQTYHESQSNAENKAGSMQYSVFNKQQSQSNMDNKGGSMFPQAYKLSANPAMSEQQDTSPNLNYHPYFPLPTPTESVPTIYPSNIPFSYSQPKIHDNELDAQQRYYANMYPSSKPAFAAQYHMPYEHQNYPMLSQFPYDAAQQAALMSRNQYHPFMNVPGRMMNTLNPLMVSNPYLYGKYLASNALNPYSMSLHGFPFYTDPEKHRCISREQSSSEVCNKHTLTKPTKSSSGKNQRKTKNKSRYGKKESEIVAVDNDMSDEVMCICRNNPDNEEDDEFVYE